MSNNNGIWIIMPIRKITISNFIKMINRGNITELEYFKKNHIGMENLLLSMGVSAEMLDCPAHRETLEKYVAMVLDEIIDAISSRGESGYEINFDEEYNLHFVTDSFSVQHNYDIEVSDRTYTIQKKELKSSLGSTITDLKGELDKCSIELKVKDSSLRTKSETERKMKLDKWGCVQSIIHVGKTTQTYISVLNISDQGDEKEETIDSMILRRNNSIVKGIHGEKIIGVKWDGDPTTLNEEEPQEKAREENIKKTVKKYPNLMTMYSEIFGISFDDPSWGEVSD